MEKNFTLLSAKHVQQLLLYSLCVSIYFLLNIPTLKAQQIDGKGANTPFSTLEAENGIKEGGAILRNFTGIPSDSPMPELEASGRAFVELNAVGQSVSWTNTTGINSNTIVIRSCIPDAPEGGGIDATLNLYVNGEFRQALNLTSKYTWVYGEGWETNTPSTPGKIRRYYDETRAFITGTPIAPGSTIMLRKDAENTANFYYVDLIDLEEVGPPLVQPANSISVLDEGAIPDDGIDDSQAFNKTITKCQISKKIMWIPPGVFHTKGKLIATGITIAGAGMWYSTHYRLIDAAVDYRHKFELTDCNVRDLYMFAPAVSRAHPDGEDYGMTMNGTKGWLVERVWAHNLGVGFWMTGVNGTIQDCRSSGSWGDGINLNNGSKIADGNVGANLICRNNFVRGNTDDGIALNAQNGSGTLRNMEGIQIINNTSVSTIWANGIRIAGGKGTILRNNLVTDVADNNGIKVAIYGGNGNPLESITVSNNLVMRGTGYRRIGAGNAGIHVTSRGSGIVIDSNTVMDSEIGFIIEHCSATFSNNTVVNPSLQGFKIVQNAIGSAKILFNTVKDIHSGQLAYQKLSSPSFNVIAMIGNSWQALPVKLTNYYVQKDKNEAKIHWTTLTETNNSHFTLSRSQDGEHFKELAKIIGASYSSSFKNYEFQDKDPLTGTNYYRLVQYDFNGDSTDYGVKTVKFSLNNTASVVYPNPSNGKFTINLNDNTIAETNILMYDLNGKTVYTQSYNSKVRNINVDTKLPSGSYVLKIISGDYKEVKKIIIQ